MTEIEFITFACTNPDRLASFWERAIDGERRDLPSSLEPEIVDRLGEGPDLLFKPQPKGTERDLPIHLDLSTEDREATVDRLRELGASVRETKTETHETRTAVWTILEDPAGNGFCVSEYDR
ncbi:VOC family protein [Natrinema sp. H-ect4]|uniref:VOC family protein n=1 Tax=Natrinema sp. H-ect4 TaxID=3242699 RepID=UPI0035A92ECB